MQIVQELIKNWSSSDWETLWHSVCLLVSMVIFLINLLLSKRSSKRETTQNNNLKASLKAFADSFQILIASLQNPSKTEPIQESSNNMQLTSSKNSETLQLLQELKALEQKILQIKEDSDK